MSENTPTKERGRPRTFDIDEALQAALQVFWREGFLNASLSDLTAAMGINKPSLYAAFGDKQALYLAALERYAALHLKAPAERLGANPDGRAAVRDFLRALSTLFVDPSLPGGCFIVNGSADSGAITMPKPVESALQKALRGNEALLRARLERAAADGQLPAGRKPAALASFFMATVAGMSVMAKNGAGRAVLDTVADTALAVWDAGRPGSTEPVRRASARRAVSSRPA